MSHASPSVTVNGQAVGGQSSGRDCDAPPRWRRADLHCHSVASTEADEAVLNALACPECYSEPADVLAQARSRDMDFYTITDHDCIDGVLSLGRRDDLIVGEELTCYFPEDHCKMHVLVWGITPLDHANLQARAADIYEVADYIERHRIAHAVAHPLYRQNDTIGRWHLERLLLMFKGFECINGAHSVLHKNAFEPVLDHLTEKKLVELTARHGMRPRWPEPWVKARTGGSDDHGLLNVGRTWTEFPPEVTTCEQALESIRNATCRPGGEAGSSLKLAHNFLGVGIRYWTRNMAPTANNGRDTLVTQALQTLVGERRRPSKRDLVKAAVRHGFAAAGRRIASPFRRKKSPAAGTALLGELAFSSLLKRPRERAAIFDAMRRGVAPLGEHEQIFKLVSVLNRDITSGVFAHVAKELARGEMAAIFDALSTLAAQQFGLLPYYFALFHQNKERHLCGGITGFGREVNGENIKIGLFTDTFDEVNGVARFLKRLGGEADRRGRHLTIATCSDAPKDEQTPFRKNFEPAASLPMPHYPELKLSLPPVLEILEWADRQQFDVIHISTPGPMGLVGWLVAKMLKVPVLATYHTDFPAFVREMTGDYRLTAAATSYMGWFYNNAATVFARSRSYESALAELGISKGVVRVLPPCTDPENFTPRHRDAGLFERSGIQQPLRLLYVGRVSAEKNLKLLADAFSKLCVERHDVALIVVGEGPYLPELKKQLNGLPAHFPGYKKGAELAAYYASADLFVFPSRTDTLGQAVIEAQASGLPVLVSEAGGPKEVMDDDVTGRIVASTEAEVWCSAIDELLDDVAARSRMSRNAVNRATRYTRSDVFDTYWEQHVKTVREATIGDVWCEPKRPASSAAATEPTAADLEVAAS
ncbi:glycosyltransferase [Humisphaera borealis]|uniref:Glycosyltransferase n=1 Tax=Humisphaera borealis TaxID=2807512 RepID=A0A7M2WZ79_9BACT|nr:glycosyltransferase [Humisphaera borealis]QOV90827.1 glycosyltransferase [Humisphaera borealis]